MRTFIIFSILVFLLPLVLVHFLTNITHISNVPLDKDTTLHAGEGEICENSYTKIECQEGLVCTPITEKPRLTAVCLKPGTKLNEDLSYKYTIEKINSTN